MEEEKKPKTFLKIFFIIIVTALLTTIIVLVGLSFYVVKYNPFNVQACFVTSFLGVGSDEGQEDGKKESDTKTNNSVKTDHLLLNESQEKMLEEAGVDVDSLPVNISPVMEACFREKLGNQKVDEIIRGATPGPLDIFKAKACL